MEKPFECYPLKFIPVYKDYIWGGRNLERLGRRLPPGTVAESWELSGHPDGISVIANGVYAGMPFPEYLRRFGKAAVGRGLPREYADDFPLLIKLIDAHQKLSVQVHPDDAYAELHEHGQRGKHEIWVIIEAEPEAEIVYGLKPGTDRGTFSRAIAEGHPGDCLQTVRAKAGDVFAIPAGKVHGLGAGIVLAEIQQSSNLTYRIFDYNRRDAQGNRRPLHVKNALEVIDFVDHGENSRADKGVFQGKVLAETPYFQVELKSTQDSLQGLTDGERFTAILVLKGSGHLHYPNGQIPVRQAETLFIPATLGAYQYSGELEWLEIRIP